VREHLIWDAIPFDIPAPIYEAWDQKQKGAAVEAHGTSCSTATARSSRNWPPNSSAA
jgi:hypothetical protein